MKGKGKVYRIAKAIQMLMLGVGIEVMRKILEIKIGIKKNFTSESVIRMSNNLSRLGVKWMILSNVTQYSPVMEPRV